MAVPVAGFLAILVLGLSFTALAYLNLNRSYHHAFWKVLWSARTPREAFTEKGWRYWTLARIISMVGVLWVVLTPWLV
jgi:hypothetical protein